MHPKLPKCCLNKRLKRRHRYEHVETNDHIGRFIEKKPGSTTWNSVSINTKAFLLFLLIFLTGGAIWELAVSLSLLSPLIPAPSLIVSQGFELIRDPFYSNGVNDAGIGIHLLASIQRVLTGFLLAAAIAVPLGFMIGMSAVLSKAIDPFIQVMRRYRL